MVYDFGQRLQKLRKQKRMTQAQTAERLGLSKATISGYENNTKTPSLEVLRQLSVLYNVSSDYLLGLNNREMLCIDGISPRQRELIDGLLKEFGKRK